MFKFNKIVKEVIKKTEKFIRHLQKASEERKRFFIALGTALTMIIIIVIWAQSFQAPENSVQTTSDQNQISFWDTFKNGLSILGQGILDKTEGLLKTLKKPNEIIITPK